MSEMNEISDSVSIEPDDISNESICGCGHPKSSHNLYGCACGCNVSSETLDDFDSLVDENDILRKQLDIAINVLPILREHIEVFYPNAGKTEIDIINNALAEINRIGKESGTNLTIDNKDGKEPKTWTTKDVGYITIKT